MQHLLVVVWCREVGITPLRRRPGVRCHYRPHVINFATIVRDMERGGAIRVVKDEDELASRLASVWTESWMAMTRGWRDALSRRGGERPAVSSNY